ncbi:MAG: 4'-phosphopantetheinyl transferase superfamily protein [Undibacterium sp.]|nr:4'-phosphopantetheinyl transferase superfamily protein [Undibacterium sp.]
MSFLPQSVPVYGWPENRELALQELTKNRLVVFSIATQIVSYEAISHDADRRQIRKQIRVALTDLLCAALDCLPEHINLTHEPGKPPGNNLSISLPDSLPGHQISISISYEQGLSVAAICLDGSIGIDLVRIDTQIEWHAVAELYLGKQMSAEIAKAPLLQQASYFALRWASLEAKLKYHQLALTEWSPELELALSGCAIRELDLPQGYAGALALPSPIL